MDLYVAQHSAELWRPLLGVTLAVLVLAGGLAFLFTRSFSRRVSQIRAYAERLLDPPVFEQPLPAGDDAALAAVARVIPVCADESVHDRASLAALAGKYDAVNIKLDKTGGLTEALALATAAQAAGFDLMVGCMISTSLGIAPAMLVAARARVVDLDGPLLLAADRPDGLRYDGSTVYPAAPALWG